MNSGLSVIAIPMFNESATAKEVLLDVIGSLEPNFKNTHVLVIDDGSNDGTCKILGGFQDINVIRHARRSGVGEALQSALTYCSKVGASYLLWHVGNGRIPFAYSKRALDVIVNGNADFVHGSRYLSEGSSSGSTFLKQRLLFLGNLLIRTMNPAAPSDVTCGVRAIRLDVLPKAHPIRLGKLGYGAEQWMDILMIEAGVRRSEVPVSIRERQIGQRSHFRWHHFWEVFLPWLKAWIKHRKA